MEVQGGCYCRAIRYTAAGEPLFSAQCHCRECQYLAGGSPNVFMAMPAADFTYTQGQPKAFARKDLANPVTREFCGECGTHLVTRSPNMPAGVILKVGGMDDPSQFPGPQMAIFCIDKQSYHRVPEGVPEFERLPG